VSLARIVFKFGESIRMTLNIHSSWMTLNIHLSSHVDGNRLPVSVYLGNMYPLYPATDGQQTGNNSSRVQVDALAIGQI